MEESESFEVRKATDDLRRLWAPPGVRPVAFAQVEREYSYAYAALSPFDGELVSLVLPTVNAEMMALFLKEASRQYPNEPALSIFPHRTRLPDPFPVDET